MVEDAGDFWVFPGFPASPPFRKVLLGRPMSAEEYLQIVVTPGGVSLKGFSCGVSTVVYTTSGIEVTPDPALSAVEYLLDFAETPTQRRALSAMARKISRTDENAFPFQMGLLCRLTFAAIAKKLDDHQAAFAVAPRVKDDKKSEVVVLDSGKLLDPVAVKIKESEDRILERLHNRFDHFFHLVKSTWWSLPTGVVIGFIAAILLWFISHLFVFWR